MSNLHYMPCYKRATITFRSSSRVNVFGMQQTWFPFELSGRSKKTGEVSQGFSRALFQDFVDYYDYFTLIDIHDMNTILPALFA